MMHHQSYILVESTYFLQHPQISYGIALVEEDGDSDGAIIQTICDISPNRQNAMLFAELCNRLKPPKNQLMELLEEFLG